MTLAAEQEPTSPRPVVEVAVGVLIDGVGAVLLLSLIHI